LKLEVDPVRARSCLCVEDDPRARLHGAWRVVGATDPGVYRERVPPCQSTAVAAAASARSETNAISLSQRGTGDMPELSVFSGRA
jgi:hypothetical protein